MVFSNRITGCKNSVSEDDKKHDFYVGAWGGIDHLSSTWMDKTVKRSILFKGAYSPNPHLILFGSYLNVRNSDIQIGGRSPIKNILEPSLYYTLHSFNLFTTPIYEHNVSIINRFTTSTSPLRFQGDLGWNFRFVDFDTDKIYPTSFPIWSLGLLTTPTESLDLNLLLNNSRYDTPLSISYIELEIQSQWHFPYNISVSFNTGIAFSGTFAVAGFLDRYYVQVGVIYEN